MPRIAILDDYQQVALTSADWTSLPDCEVTSFATAFPDQDVLLTTLEPFEIVCLMRERTPFPRSVFEGLPKLRLLVSTGTGNASVDLTAARDHGVTVCHTRSGATEHGTAELAWALILACARNLVQEDRALRKGRWQTTIGPMLHGKTLGLLGLGRLGRRMAEIGQAFGMQVVAWSPNLDAERSAAGGAALVTKAELFRSSDVVSLHLVLSEKTRNIVGEEELGLMQPHAILVNTSRAALVDETALLNTLASRDIAAAGLDVMHREPLDPSSPLFALDNVVLSPHLGYVTSDTYRVFFNDIVEDIAAYLNGNPIRAVQPRA